MYWVFSRRHHQFWKSAKLLKSLSTDQSRGSDSPTQCLSGKEKTNSIFGDVVFPRIFPIHRKLGFPRGSHTSLYENSRLSIIDTSSGMLSLGMKVCFNQEGDQILRSSMISSTWLQCFG